MFRKKPPDTPALCMPLNVVKLEAGLKKDVVIVRHRRKQSDR